MSWCGKILRVDLTAGRCSAEPMNTEWAGLYLGQRGLGTKYLFEEVDPAVDSLSPANKLIFVTGPLTGTAASTGGRYSVVTKGALGGAIAASNSGGHWGAELKFAGWDMIILEGRSPEPVYLSIRDETAELLPAGGFVWGKSVWETDAALKARHQEPQLRIAAIGAAGENLVRYACIVNDLDRAPGRSGVGAVMGSKNLKAIAVRGTRGVRIADPEAFFAASRICNAKIAAHEWTGRALPTYGTLPMIDVTNEHGSLPTRNNRDVQFEGTGRINALAMHARRATDGKSNFVRNKGCFGCTIACGRVVKMDPGHFSVKDKGRYHGAGGGLEYEAAFSLGAMTGVDDLEACTYANYLCNEHGMDPISFGVVVAAAMELYETGAIGDAVTGNVRFRFGSAEALCVAAELTGAGTDFGRDLGLGAKRLCDKYGHPEFAMVVKGQEFPGYDARAMQGMGLAYATSNRGACHMRASPFADDFARITPDGKAEVVKRTQDELSAIDSTGLCAFTSAALSFEDYAALIGAACGGTWSAERLLEIGERVWNLERQFNLAAGFTRADDTLPDRCLKTPAPSGRGSGRVCELDSMLPEYYRLRGWTEDGRPSDETLTRLAL